MKTLIISALLALGLCLPGSSARAKTYVVPEKDIILVKTVGQAGISELKIAGLGVQKAADNAVKEFATLLVKDQTLVNQDLKALADLKGVPLSPVIAQETTETFKALEKKNGKEFDKAFIEEMKKCHDSDIKTFEAAQKETGDPEIKAFIDKTLPVLRTHADMLKKL